MAVGTGVGVAAVWVHHWFIEDESKADRSEFRSCWLNPVLVPAGSARTWFA